MWIVLSIFAVGILLGVLLRPVKHKIKVSISKTTFYIIVLLVFLMGIQAGENHAVTKHLGEVLGNALLIGGFSVLGSMLLVKLFVSYNKFDIGRLNNLVPENNLESLIVKEEPVLHESSDEASEVQPETMDDVVLAEPENEASEVQPETMDEGVMAEPESEASAVQPEMPDDDAGLNTNNKDEK